MAEERKAPKPKVVLDDADKADVRDEKPLDMQPEPEVSGQDVPASSSQAQGAQGAASAPEDADGTSKYNVFAWVRKTFPGHEKSFWGGICGLMVAIFIFVIGFWRTLLIVVLVLVGIACGQVLDGDPKMIALLRRLFSGRE